MYKIYLKSMFVGIFFVTLIIISTTVFADSEYVISWEDRGSDTKSSSRRVSLDNCHSSEPSVHEISLENISRNSIQYKTENTWRFGLTFNFGSVTVPLDNEIKKEFGFVSGSELKSVETIKLPVDPHQHIIYKVFEKEDWVEKRAKIIVPRYLGLGKERKTVEIKYRRRVWLDYEVAEREYCEMETKTRSERFTIDMRPVRGDEDFWGTPCVKLSVVIQPKQRCVDATINVELYECRSANGPPSGDGTAMKGRQSHCVYTLGNNTRFSHFLDSNTRRLTQVDSFRKGSRAGLTVKNYGSKDLIRNITFTGDTEGKDIDKNRQFHITLNEIPILVKKR